MCSLEPFESIIPNYYLCECVTEYIDCEYSKVYKQGENEPDQGLKERVVDAHCEINSIEVVKDEDSYYGQGPGGELGMGGVKVEGIFYEKVQGDPEG